MGSVNSMDIFFGTEDIIELRSGLELTNFVWASITVIGAKLDKNVTDKINKAIFLFNCISILVNYFYELVLNIYFKNSHILHTSPYFKIANEWNSWNMIVKEKFWSFRLPINKCI
jgi:hypothetical protein